MFEQRQNNAWSEANSIPMQYVVFGKSDSSRIIGLPATVKNSSIPFDLKNYNCPDENVKPEDALETILDVMRSDPNMRRKYLTKSFFLIGSGAFGTIFRAVTFATGSSLNPKYPEEYVQYLMQMYKSNKTTKKDLLDSTRDPSCLDLVAVKCETISPSDLENRNSLGKINLIREFLIMTELHNSTDAQYTPVGIPLPIEFSYLGNNRLTQDLSKVIIYDPVGAQNTFKNAYLETNNIINLKSEQVTNSSYMSMELLGPNLDEWKELFKKHRGFGDGKLAFTVQTTFKLMDQLLCRLLVMHRKNIVHLDLKPDNVCLGMGKMVNTVYLLDYGLSRICSNEKPDITVGSRRYMSVGMLMLEPANYMMDVESWFYVLIILLCDYIPWSDEALSPQLEPDEQENPRRDEKLMELSIQCKKQFWNDDGKGKHQKLLNILIGKIEKIHSETVPDVGGIIQELYKHLQKMRKDYYKKSHMVMNMDLRYEESDLFKRYKTIRKILLHVYDENFGTKGTCFYNDKDLSRRQIGRRETFPMLAYTRHGQNWLWDWDVWWEELYEDDIDNYNSPSSYNKQSKTVTNAS